MTPKELVSLVVSPEEAIIAKFDSKQMSATGVYTDGSTADKTDSVQWSADYSTLAFISDYRTSGTNGLLETAFTELACDPPSVTAVEATCNSACDANLYQGITKSDRTNIYVSKLEITSVVLNQTSITINESDNTNFIATATLSDDSTTNLTRMCRWSSSNGNAYAYDSPNRGLVRGDNAGTAVITATCDTFIKTATVTVQ